uniref:Uncharacterized protein n=1 Tax=Lepeophtheirus salmonis TaxID=72036 RepID=A0A0K2U0T8_LEPSM
MHALKNSTYIWQRTRPHKAKVKHVRIKNQDGTIVVGLVEYALIFVEGKMWLIAGAYIEILDMKVLPWAREMFGDNIVFTQD